MRNTFEVRAEIDGHVWTADVVRGFVVAVSIYRDNVWAGDGRFELGSGIVDCAATLGEDVYEALDTAIADELDA